MNGYESYLIEAIEEAGFNYISSTREHRLGTRLILPTGEAFQYAKIDLGSLGKINGKITRSIQYRWIRVPL